ncbi:hypothetical protein HDU96_002101 [Phlyctochytrium bullatum]|nr:hypothetical protein HDU96_002101 [Phlyctochytrium bullatum]
MFALALSNGKAHITPDDVHEGVFDEREWETTEQIEHRISEAISRIDDIRKSHLSSMWNQIANCELRLPVVSRVLSLKLNRLKNISVLLDPYTEMIQSAVRRESQLYARLQSTYEKLRYQSCIIESLVQELNLRKSEIDYRESLLADAEANSVDKAHSKFVDSGNTLVLMYRDAINGLPADVTLFQSLTNKQSFLPDEWRKLERLLNDAANKLQPLVYEATTAVESFREPGQVQM